MKGVTVGPILTSLEAFGEQFLEAEEFCRLRHPRVMFADYELIVRDFAPRFGRPGNAIHDERRAGIDAFLVEHCGVISAPQVQNTTNTRIPIKRPRRLGYRPPYYGRAAVIPVEDPPRLIDVKGVGVQPGETPRSEAYCTGLLTATEALHEVLFERLCAAAFRHAGGDYEVIPTYAVLDLGFAALPWRNRRGEPAFAIARRAHTRPRTLWDDDEPPGEVAVGVMRDIALLLRRYGITTTAGNYRIERRDDDIVLHARNEEFVFRGAEADRVIAATRYVEGALPLDAINVQYTPGVSRPQVFDFGSYGASSEFTAPIYIATSAAEIDLVGEIIHCDDPRFPSADILQIPKRANVLASRLAGKYTRGECIGPMIGLMIDRFVQRCFRADPGSAGFAGRKARGRTSDQAGAVSLR